MGETLAETRLAVEAQRTELERTAAQLREALDVRKQFAANPVPFVAVGAAAAFVLVGGPGRVAGLVRRQFFPTNPEKAYDSLPKPMQAWVDHMAGAVGPRSREARQLLAEELATWRKDPRKHGKVSKRLAKQIAEGPPGPRRAAWTAAETVTSIFVAALARKAIGRLLSGEPAATGSPDSDVIRAQSRPSTAAAAPGSSPPKAESTGQGYAGISARPEG